MRAGGNSGKLGLSMHFRSDAMSTLSDDLAHIANRNRGELRARLAALVLSFLNAEGRKCRTENGSSKRAELILDRQRRREPARARADCLLLRTL